MSSQEHTIIDWTLRVVSDQNALAGSYTVHFFLGPVPEAPVDWLEATSYIGQHFAFTDPNETDKMMIWSMVDLIEVLQDRGLSSLEPHVVVPFVQENLHWRVQKVCITSLTPSLSVT
jgi:tyrosinase